VQSQGQTTTSGTSLQLCGPEYTLTPMETVSSTNGSLRQCREAVSRRVLVRLMPNASCVHKKALHSSFTIILPASSKSHIPPHTVVDQYLSKKNIKTY
jgi:hypothetical protein